jgi:hypothetical protein
MAAGATYEPIATYTIPSAVASYTFSSIPATYTDLILIISGYGVTSDNVATCQVGNGSVDTGTNYSTTYISGNGTSASSGRYATQSFMRIQSQSGMGTTSAHIGSYITHFMNYSNTTTYKTVLCRANQNGGSYPATEASVNLWRSTSAINTIKVFPYTGASLGTGTMLTLYGIKAA